MRNIDKIRGLENQLEELKRQKEKAAKDRDTLLRANREIQAANDAVMIAVALEYGKDTQGGYEISIPKVDVAQLLLAWDVSAFADGDRRVIRAVHRLIKAEGDNDGADA